MIDPLDEMVIRWTVRISMACYAAFLLVRFARGASSNELHENTVEVVARWLWTAGWLIFLLHLLAAFELFHHWSHAHAYEHTAQITERTVGLKWGGGVYFNYVFALIWSLDVTFWWLKGSDWPSKHPRYQIALHVFFGFMVFNATVVFGPRGWVIVATLVAGVLATQIYLRKKAALN